MNNTNIDIIIPWVDGSDPNWIKEKERVARNKKIVSKANNNNRYESWDNLQYIFRGIEKYMPWVHKIFLVTFGHLPTFLNTNNPKLEIIKHTDFIPEKYLPTFNSSTIEMNFHRIPSLSENYIEFNDDTFPMAPIEKEYYFKDNMVCEEAVETPIMPVDVGDVTQYSLMLKMNNMCFINRHFSKREVQSKNPDKWFFENYGELLKRTEGLKYWNNFVGFHDRHMPVALKKSTLEKLWEIEPETLDIGSRNQFRDYTDLNQYLIRYWQICEGDFIPRKTLGEPYLVTINNYKEVVDDILNNKHQMVCFTEDCTPEEFLIIKSHINNALQIILPDKSSFEK